MIGKRNGTTQFPDTAGPLRAHRPLPLELQWDAHRPLPTRWVLPKARRVRAVPLGGGPHEPLDFCGRMRRVCEDVADRCEALRHVRMLAVLLSFTPSRNRSLYGL